MRRWGLIIVFCCLLPIFVLGICSMADVDPQISKIERRVLKGKPAFSLAALFSGSYTRELEEYYADTFPFRDGLMSVSKSMGSFYKFSAGGENTLIIQNPAEGQRDMEGGGESAIKPVPAENKPPEEDSPPIEETPPQTSLEDVTGQAALRPPDEKAVLPELQYPDASEVQKMSGFIIIGDRAMEAVYAVPSLITRYAGIMNDYAKLLPNSQVYTLITPNSAEFFSPVSMHTGKASQKDMIASMYSQLDNSVRGVDAYDAIARHINEYVYFRTDHHWTALGAYYAYTAFCKSAGIEPVPLDSFESGSFDRFLGSFYTLASKYPQGDALKNNPDSLTYYLPVVECTQYVYQTPELKDGIKMPVVARKMRNDNKYLCFIAGDNPVTVIETSVKNSRSILVLKESYGNAFVPFLTSHYQTIYVVDPRKVGGKNQPKFNLPEFVNKHGINDLIFINYPFIINSKGYCGMLERLK